MDNTICIAVVGTVTTHYNDELLISSKTNTVSQYSTWGDSDDGQRTGISTVGQQYTGDGDSCR
jgi:hypothetical protein